MNDDEARSSPAQRWAVLRAHFEELADLAAPERERRMRALESVDPALARELAQMIAADAQATGVLERPAATEGETTGTPAKTAGSETNSSAPSNWDAPIGRGPNSGVSIERLLPHDATPWEVR